MPVERAVALIDKAATDTLGHALNPEQRQAASAILASTDRFVTIQGGAGTGKSTVFAAASPAQPSLADRQQFGRTTIILDEASMVSTRQMLGLMQIAEKLGVNRLVLVGDVGQIAAVEAGSPFRQIQEAVLNPIRLDANLRQRDGDMKLAVAKLQAGMVREAFNTLGKRVVENADPVAAAAKAWLALDDKVRADTALFTSGHHLREQLLDKVRAALVAEGKLGAEEIRLPTLENLNMTREQMRSVNSYAPGLVLDVHRDTPAIGLERGSYAVLSADPKAREVMVADGKGEHRFRPETLHPNGNGVSLSRPSEISVRAGDTLQWTANDKRVGATNGQPRDRPGRLRRCSGRSTPMTATCALAAKTRPIPL